MGRYASKLKDIIGITIKGYGVGYIISLILGYFILGGFSWSMFGDALVLDVFVGSGIVLFKSGSSGMQNTLASAAVNAARGMLGSVFSAGFGWGIGMVFFVCKLVFFGVIAVVLILFAMISYPVNVLYTTVMYLIEKYKGDIDDELADTLDKWVPIIGVVIVIIVLFITM